MKTKQRDLKLDFIRTIAIMSVIWIHCMEQSSLASLLYGNTILYLFGRMGVPLFLMITGATMIDREYESLTNFYIKKLLPLYLVSVFWCFIYGIGMTDFMTNLVNSLKIIVLAKHLWYLPLLLQLYAILPFLSYMKKMSNLDLILLLILCICINWLGLFKVITIDYGNMASFGLIYVLYGYLCYDRKIYRKLPLLFWLLLFAVFVFLFVWTDWNPAYQTFFANLGLDIWWYYSPFLMLAGLAFYPLLLSIEVSGRIFTTISQCSFGVFAIHLFCLQKISIYAEVITFNVLRTFVLFALTFGCSLFISFVVGKIPYIKRIVWQ